MPLEISLEGWYAIYPMQTGEEKAAPIGFCRTRQLAERAIEVAGLKAYWERADYSDLPDMNGWSSISRDSPVAIFADVEHAKKLGHASGIEFLDNIE
jgi:hypothetical protein